jgi:hypothetical protein
MALATTPTAGTHREDDQKVDKLLDASEQSVREAFEPADLLPQVTATERVPSVDLG